MTQKDAFAAIEKAADELVLNGDELPGALSLTASPPSVLLAEVGDRLAYELTVANTSTDPLEDVTIVERVAPEIHVIAAPLVKGVDAVQVGRFLAKEDIVWIIDELEPGAEVVLPWRGEVQAAGDLAVTSSARATARRTDPVTASVEHFLASPNAPTEELNPRYRPIRRRVAIATPGAVSTPGRLPVTGLTGLWTALGLLAVLVGFTLWRFGSPLARGKRVPAALLLLCIVTAACVSSSEPDDPQAIATPEVKGRRIERGDNQDDEQNEAEASENEGSSNQGADGDPEGSQEDPGEQPDTADESAPDVDENDPANDATAGHDTAGEDDQPMVPPARDGDTVTFVTRELSLDDLPTRDAASLGGTGGWFEWDASSRSMVSSGSALASREPGGEAGGVFTRFKFGGDTVLVEVTLQNGSDDERLHVDGHLVHAITGGGATTELVSDPIDVVLAPRGKTVATFEYLVPTGRYFFLGSYLAD
jgi:hypothetical protein